MKSALLLLATLTLISCDDNKEPTQAEKVKARVEAQRQKSKEKPKETAGSSFRTDPDFKKLDSDEQDRIFAANPDPDTSPVGVSATYRTIFGGYEKNGIEGIPREIAEQMFQAARIRHRSQEFQYVHILSHTRGYQAMRAFESGTSGMPAADRAVVVAAAELHLPKDWQMQAVQVSREAKDWETLQTWKQSGIGRHSPQAVSALIGELALQMPGKWSELARVVKRDAEEPNSPSNTDGQDRIDAAKISPDSLPYRSSRTYAELLAGWQRDGIEGIPRPISDKIIAEATTRWRSPNLRLSAIDGTKKAYLKVIEFETTPTNMPAAIRQGIAAYAAGQEQDGWILREAAIRSQTQGWNKVRARLDAGIPGHSPEEAEAFVEDAIIRYSGDWQTIENRLAAWK